MSRITGILLGCVAAGAISCSANAADMALKARPMVAPIYDWTGFYLGVSAGGIWNDPEQSVAVSGPANGGNNSIAAQNAIAQFTGERSHSWLVGGQAGSNWQMDNKLVLGIEADISGTDLNSAQSITNIAAVGSGPNIITSASQHLDYFGTVRGRVGYAGVENLLAFVTGGLAYGGGNSTFGVASTTGFGRAGVPFNLMDRDSSVRVGWTVGAGAEVHLASFGPNWSVKGEYLYYDLGRDHLAVSHTAAPIPPGFTAATDPEFRGSLIRVGLNYKINGPIVARY
jgi:outer membrane immunogenic protein